MVESNFKTLEHYAHKADRKGFFKEWQHLTFSMVESKDIPYDQAGEEAYKQLKVQGSE